MEKVEFTAVIFKEDNTYVALSPELNVSSFGDTVEEAKRALAEAVEAFLEECRNQGSLSEILEEAGFLKAGHIWIPRTAVAQTRLTVSA